MSSRRVAAPAPAPATRFTLVAPILPLPAPRTSVPVVNRTIRYPNGIEPRRYPASGRSQSGMASALLRAGRRHGCKEREALHARVHRSLLPEPAFHQIEFAVSSTAKFRDAETFHFATQGVQSLFRFEACEREVRLKLSRLARKPQRLQDPLDFPGKFRQTAARFNSRPQHPRMPRR